MSNLTVNGKLKKKKNYTIFREAKAIEPVLWFVMIYVTRWFEPKSRETLRVDEWADLREFRVLPRAHLFCFVGTGALRKSPTRERNSPSFSLQECVVERFLEDFRLPTIFKSCFERLSRSFRIPDCNKWRRFASKIASLIGLIR